jgi:hypothetical protein
MPNIATLTVIVASNLSGVRAAAHTNLSVGGGGIPGHE